MPDPPSRPTAGPLGVRLSEHAGVTVVALSGELDISTVGLIPGDLERRTPDAVIVFDLSALDFVDSVGLSALIEQQRVLGPRMRLVKGRPALQRVLHVSGLDRFLPSCDTLEQAVTG